MDMNSAEKVHGALLECGLKNILSPLLKDLQQ